MTYFKTYGKYQLEFSWLVYSNAHFRSTFCLRLFCATQISLQQRCFKELEDTLANEYVGGKHGKSGRSAANTQNCIGKFFIVKFSQRAAVVCTSFLVHLNASLNIECYFSFNLIYYCFYPESELPFYCDQLVLILPIVDFFAEA